MSSPTELPAQTEEDTQSADWQIAQSTAVTPYVPQPAQGSTLLPASVANAVSFVTRSSSLYIRLGTFIGGLAIDGARVTTLTGLELSRAVIEGIIHRAGKDVADRSIGELGRVEADGLLERSITTLHSTITGISFAASAGFHFSSTALSSATDISQQLLGTLDAILGSTDSSRAIASIITLIRREFQNPATGVEGEKVSVGDLLLGICALALLQKWCRKLTDLECKDQNYEDVIWDVVILNDGRRADVVGKTATYEHGADIEDLQNGRRLSFLNTKGDEMLETVERGRTGQEDTDEMSEASLKERILQSLPANSSVLIKTSTTTTKTITVEFSGTEPLDFSPPPGVEVVENLIQGADLDRDSLDTDRFESSQSRFRIVYRIVGNKLRSTNICREGSDEVDEDDMEYEHTERFENVEDVEDSAARPTMISHDVLQLSDISSQMSDKESSVPRLKRAASKSKIPRLASHTGTSDDEKLPEMPLTVLTPTGSDNVANQKRSRKPASTAFPASGSEKSSKKPTTRSTLLKKSKTEKPTTFEPEKKGTFRQALKRRSPTTLSNLWNKDESKESIETRKPQPRPAWGSRSDKPSTQKTSSSHQSMPLQRINGVSSVEEIPRSPQRGNPNYFSSRDLGIMHLDNPRTPSRASYYSIYEQRRDSIISQTDTYSLYTGEQSVLNSPTRFRTHIAGQNNLIKARGGNATTNLPKPPSNSHHRVHSYEQSIFTLNTNNSETSLVPTSRIVKGAFESTEGLQSLVRTGTIDGSFPEQHIVRNITRFVKYASASYGSSFLRMMGISDPTKRKEIDTLHHHEHQSFSHHAQLPADSILLSSFFDPQGGTDSSGHTNTGVPMVHFVSLDHQSKAVVLTCRGTLGFEDVLADMTCDYDELIWRGKAYKVHMGIHASARRLLDGGGGRVIATIKAALEEFPDYGLVMCGHSLGGGVTALLAIMISEPAVHGTSFVTSYNQGDSNVRITGGDVGNAGNIHLPPGRPIHVYAYGPPATVSPSLRLATRGLITTIVNGQDLVPYLSLGLLHDLQSVALAFKNDDSGAKAEVKSRVWTGMSNSFSEKWYGQPGKGNEEEDDKWSYAALKALRASMLSVKLLPPGEVFMVETMPVLKRNAFAKDEGDHAGLGKPATRSILKYIRNVEKKFGEIRFGGSMLLDHSPGRYESSLNALGRGILDD